jgi:hypothetical protein
MAEIDELVENPQIVQTSKYLSTRAFRPRWERSLPAKLVIASVEDKPSSLKLKVNIETTDTGEVKSLSSLVDSGATGNFIDWDYVRSNRLTTRRLSKPVPVYNVDGTPNEAGSITEVADLILRYKNHSERTLFAVTGLGKQNLLLGHTWLLKHNPEIDWATSEVKMFRCSARCCSGCRNEIREERRAQKAEIRRIAKCSAGPLPTHVEDSDDEEDFPTLVGDTESEPSDEVSDIGFEEGDRLFTAGLSQPETEIRATSSISQRLAEAFKRNTALDRLEQLPTDP